MIEYQGPVPPPEFLHSYSQAIENGGERLFSMIEAEGAHVREQEKKILTAQISLLKRGQLFACLIALASIGSATYVVQFSEKVAGGLVVAGVGTLAVAFLNAARGSKKPSDGEEATKKPPRK